MIYCLNKDEENVMTGMPAYRVHTESASERIACRLSSPVGREMSQALQLNGSASPQDMVE